MKVKVYLIIIVKEGCINGNENRPMWYKDKVGEAFCAVLVDSSEFAPFDEFNKQKTLFALWPGADYLNQKLSSWFNQSLFQKDDVLVVDSWEEEITRNYVKIQAEMQCISSDEKGINYL